jgi:hypothetical protein
MFTDEIERIKIQYTDKYVLVDAGLPELARFRDVVGRVKTVNMNGQALVEFDDYHLNVGWYDIAPEFLKVVDKPPPKPAKPEVKKAPAKPPSAAKPQPAKAPAGKTAGKGSVADILAAARAGKAGAPAAAKPQPSASEKPPAQPADTPKPAAADRSKMSVADMLAAARAGGAAGLLPAKAKAEPAPAEPQAEAAAPQEEAIPDETIAAAPAEAPQPDSKTIQRVDKSNMSIDDMLAYCRQHDAN